MHEWPEWWNFEVAVSPHALDRMVDRNFTEIDVRIMLDEATGFAPALVPGRFCILTKWGGHPWEVIVEPDELAQLLVIVTAFRLE